MSLRNVGELVVGEVGLVGSYVYPVCKLDSRAFDTSDLPPVSKRLCCNLKQPNFETDRLDAGKSESG